MGRQAGGASGPRKHDPEHVLSRVLRDPRPEVEQLCSCLRREPLAREAAGPLGRRPQALTDLAHIRFQRLEIVLAGLDRDQSALNAAMSTPTAS